jgi:hypothetical protein
MFWQTQTAKAFPLLIVFTFYHIVSCFLILFILQFHIDYTHRILKHGYILVVTLLFHFWKNIVIIHNTGKRGLSPFIFLFVYDTYLTLADLGSQNMTLYIIKEYCTRSTLYVVFGWKINTLMRNIHWDNVTQD